MPKIIPIRELRDTNAVATMCALYKGPIYVTRYGYGEMVLMNMNAFENMAAELESLRKAAAEAEKTPDAAPMK